jgi:hypothetical protein
MPWGSASAGGGIVWACCGTVLEGGGATAVRGAPETQPGFARCRACPANRCFCASPAPSLPPFPTSKTAPLPPFLLPQSQVLRSITEVFGQDTWFSTVLVLTHGGAPPPDTRHAAAAGLQGCRWRACRAGGWCLGWAMPACLLQPGHPSPLNSPTHPLCPPPPTPAPAARASP